MSTQNLAIFTTCSNNYMAMAKVLLNSARSYHPTASLYICLADKMLPNSSFYPSGCQIITAEDLGVPDFLQFAFRYDVMEFNTALKPFMLLRLLKQGHDAALYFDPDIEIFDALEPICRKLDEGASFVLTPHLLQPAEGRQSPDDIAIMKAGTYNLGFIGVGATAETMRILEWWARRLQFQCVNDQENGLFVDQKFVDLVPGFADGVRILRDSCYNVAYWNLTQRLLAHERGKWLIDGAPLGFFHFSGFDCNDHTRLSKHTTAFRGNCISRPLAAIMQHYSKLVKTCGHAQACGIPYAYGQFSSGMPISAQARRVFRSEYEPWSGNPFTSFVDDVPPLGPPRARSAREKELERQLQAVYASTSWRLTRPVRAIKRLSRSGQPAMTESLGDPTRDGSERPGR
jgi:hypothetical protein